MADEDPEDLLPTHFLRARGRSRDLRLSQAQDHLAFHEADSESGTGISTSPTLVESFASRCERSKDLVILLCGLSLTPNRETAVTATSLCGN